MPLLRGETDTVRDDIFVEHKDTRTGVHVKTLRAQQYKYFYYVDGREVLYDLTDDAPEVFNKANDPGCREVVLQLRKRLLTRLMEVQDDLPPKTHDW